MANGEPPNGEVPPPAPPGGFSKLLLETAPKVLSGIFGTAGFVGFVVLTGAALHWARFRAAGLPADQAVSVIPRQDHLVTGAVVLTVFVIVGLLAVAVAYILDRRGAPSNPTRLGLLLLAAAGVLGAIAVADPEEGNELLATLAVIVTTVLLALTSLVFSEPLPEPPPGDGGGPPPGGAGESPSSPPDGVGGKKRGREAAELAARAPKLRQLRVAPITEVRSAIHRSGLGAIEPATAERPPPRMRLTKTGYLCQLVIAALGGLVLYFCFRAELWVLGSFIVAGILYVACLSVARATSETFRWYGLTVFLAVALFGAVISALRVLDTEQVQAAAVLLKDENQPICGVYVTETSDRFYLARLDRDHSGKGGHTGHIFWVPKADLVDWALSPLQSKRGVRLALPALSAELIADRHQRLATSEESTSGEEDKKKSNKTSTKKTRTIPPTGSSEDSCHVTTPPDPPKLTPTPTPPKTTPTPSPPKKKPTPSPPKSPVPGHG